MLPALLLLMAGQTPSVGVVVTGQSLSQGLSTLSAVSTSQTGNNQMPGSQVLQGTFEITVPQSTWPLVALNETSYALEHPRSGLCNYYRTATGVDLFAMFGGRGGQTYAGMSAGTLAWTNLQYQLESFGARANGSVIAIYNVHGESDHQAGTTRAAYKATLLQWQADYQSLFQQRTRTRAMVPMYLDQMNSYTSSGLGGHSATSPIPLAQIDTCRASPATHVCVGPKYQYDYNVTDGVHLINTSSRTMGAQAGKAIAYGASWQPLWITAATRSTSTIIVTYHVPCVDLGTCGATRLTLDTTTVTGKGAPSYGFEYTGANITNVQVCTGANAPVAGCSTTSQVAISLDANAAGTLRYAWTGTDTNFGGRTSGPRGNLRDTDTSTWVATPLYNWAMTDEWVVP